MELHHAFTVPASVDRTWETFMDLQGVAGCFPGATVTKHDGDSFEGTCKVKLGPIALVYAGSGTFVERDDESHRAVIEAMGKDKRGNGTAGATVTIAVAPDGTGASVDVTTDLNVTGKPAQFGRGVMQDVSDKLLGQFVACLEQRFNEPEPEADPATDDGSAAFDNTASGNTASDNTASDNSAATATDVPDAGGGTGASAPNGAAAADNSAATATDVPDASGTAKPAVRPAPRAVPRAVPVTASDDALDLGSAVLPVILKSYAPHLLAALVGILIGVLLGRRRR